MWLHDDELDGGSPQDGCKPGPGEYAIYGTILTDRRFRTSAKIPLIGQRTMTIDTVLADNGHPEPVRRLIGKVPGLLEETIDDFLEKNREPVDLKPVEMGFHYRLLLESARERRFHGPFDYREIEAAYRRLAVDFPGSHGLVTLSRVGFDRDR